MELRSNGSMPTAGPSNVLQDFDSRRTDSSVGTLLWWVTLMLLAAVVPACAALILMGSLTLAVTTGLITAGGVGLAALMI